jgi:hypothetical protein
VTRADADLVRLAGYVEKFFSRSGQTQWPTVRQVARALGWRQSRVEETCDGDSDGLLFLSSYFTTPEPTLGEHFVERLSKEPS